MVAALIIGGGLLAWLATRKNEDDTETGNDEGGDEGITQGDFTPGASVPHSANGNVKKGVGVARSVIQAGTALVPGLDDETRDGVNELSESLADAADASADAAAGKGPKGKKPKKPKPPKKKPVLNKRPAGTSVRTPKKPANKKAPAKTAKAAAKNAKKAAKQTKRATKKKSAK